MTISQINLKDKSKSSFFNLKINPKKCGQLFSSHWLTCCDFHPSSFHLSSGNFEFNAYFYKKIKSSAVHLVYKYETFS